MDVFSYVRPRQRFLPLLRSLRDVMVPLTFEATRIMLPSAPSVYQGHLYF